MDGKRYCSECGREMSCGYVINDGEQYFCSDQCLHMNISEEEYEDLVQEDLAYWTEWFA